MRQVSAVHYEDIYAKSFVAFRKKYLPLLKKGGGHSHYYIQFTNFMDDTLSKKPYEDPDHHDPVAIYGYPLEYVLKHPADIWYGGQAKYLRVLKARTKNKTLLLQYMTESEANSIIYKMGLPYDTLDKVRLLWPDRVGKGAGSIGRAFFQSMQMDMSAIGKIPRSKSERDTLAKTAVVRSGKDQTALLRKAGFDAIEDTARNQKAAVICDREPEQIAFLHRNAFDVVEIIPLKLSQRKATVGTSQEPRELAPKLAALVASRIGDRIVDKDEYDRTFWTAAGREIAVRFERPASYYEGKKLGEKKHKEAKLHSSYLVKVALISERGTFSPMAMASERFVDIADDVADRFSRAEPVEGAKPISKASRAAEKEAASQAFRSKEKQKKYDDLKRWAPDYLKEITEVAQKLGLPFTQAEYFNSSDDARELLDSILVVVGRGLTNEAYGAKHLLQEEGPKSWDWYSKYDREKAASAAKESISYLAEDVNADPAVVKEMSDIYEAGLNWMLDNKKWSYQAPAGFFGWLLRDMKESEPESVAAAAKLVAEAAAILADSRQVFVSAAKIDDLLKKEDNKPFEEDLKVINSEDKTPTKKYLDWGLSRLVAGDSVEDIVATMMSFEKSLPRLSEKDIKKYKTLEDISKAIEDIESKPSARGTKRKGKHSAEILFEDDNWLLLHPLNRTSAIYYGSNTSWCISRRDLTKNLYYSYSLDNIQFYILIDKSKIHEVKSRDRAAYDFSKLAIMFVKGKSHLKEPFEDANNRSPTLPVVKKALGEELFNSMNEIAREHALKHKETLAHEMVYSEDPARIAEIFSSIEDDRNLSKRMLANKHAPPELLLKFAGDDDKFVRLSVAENISTPTEALIKLAGDEDKSVRRGVAKNASTPPEALVKLAGDDDSSVIFFVANNKSSPPELLSKLSYSADYRHRCGVARNTSASAEVLTKLAGDANEDVRSVVARNTATPTEVLASLASDEEEDVRWGVAKNTSTPPEALIKLAGDEDKSVRVGAATNASTPTEALIKLADEADKGVRMGAARNTSAPLELIVKLAGDESPQVRQEVAENSSTPIEVLNKLASDSDASVREAATDALAERKPAEAVSAAGNKRSIKQIATDVRGELGFCDQDCVNQSNVLRDALREEGYKADRVFGYLLTDGYYDGAWGKSPIVWGENLEDDRRGKEVETDYHLFHNWVEVDGLIVDIGCEQFTPLLKGKKLPAVYIEKTANAIRHDGMEVVPPKLSAEATPLSAGKVSGYLVNDVIQLKDYLTLNDAGKGYEIASLVWPMFVEWAEEKQPEGVDLDGLDAEDMYADTGIDLIPQEVLASFFKWFERHGSLDGEVAPADRPTFLYMDFNRIVNNEWLVHFSDHADDIAAQGFTRGVNDVAKLGLTTHFREKAGPGFNFAYLATIAADYGRTPGGHASRWKYGKHAVMFKANGVLVYHLSDEEPQVIFLGSTAKDIVELENTDDGWVVVGKDDTPIFRSGDYDTKERKSGSSSGGLKRCVDWVKTNYDQYKNKLNQQAKAPAQNRKMAAGTNK